MTVHPRRSRPVTGWTAPAATPRVLLSRLVMTAAVLYAGMLASLLAQAPTPTVWDGVFTATQAARGDAQYAMACARCHGSGLEGGMGTSLAGTAFWNRWREQSVADLLGYVSANMPLGAQAMLSPQAYADIIAFLLRHNDLPAGQTELTAANAAGVRIVPRDGGTGELPPATLARIVGCLAPPAADGSWTVVRASRPERVKSIAGAVPAGGGGGGDRRYPLKFVLQPLASLVGHRIAVVGLLLGEGGADGINVSTITSITDACE